MFNFVIFYVLTSLKKNPNYDSAPSHRSGPAGWPRRPILGSLKLEIKISMTTTTTLVAHAISIMNYVWCASYVRTYAFRTQKHEYEKLISDSFWPSVVTFVSLFVRWLDWSPDETKWPQPPADVRPPCVRWTSVTTPPNGKVLIMRLSLGPKVVRSHS